MHLTQLVLTNFRGFASLDLSLDRHLTVLVGRNGSGKSSVMEAIALPFRVLAGNASGPRDIRLGEEEATIEQRWAPEHLFEIRVRPPHGWYSMPYALDGLRQTPFIQRSLERAAAGEGMTSARRMHLAQLIPHMTPLQLASQSGFRSYEILVAWFREREDIENRERVRRRDLGYIDPALEAARRAIVGFLGEGYTNPRIEHEGDETVLVLDKGGQALSGAQLSDGERSLIVIAGDLARQLASEVTGGDPLRSYALVLIDEIELHLHPSWQQRIIPALLETFPEVQFVVTTHSPQVLSQVPASSLRILENFACLSPQHPVLGRDANAILREIMGTTERPRFVEEMVHEFSQRLDEGRLDEARVSLDGLRALLGDTDSEVVRGEVALSFLDRGSDPGDPS